MNKVLLISLAALAVQSLPAQAEDREWMPYKKFVETFYLDKFQEVDPKQRDHLRLLLRLMPVNKDIAPESIVLTVAHAGGKDRLPVNVDGFIDVVANRGWVKEEAMIYTSLPKGEKVRIEANFASQTPDKLQLSYADLMTSVPQWNAVIKEKAGVMRFMMPKFNGVDLHFAKPSGQTVQIMAKDGVKTYTADAKGVIKLKLDDAFMQNNPQVVLSERPSLIDVDEL